MASGARTTQRRPLEPASDPEATASPPRLVSASVATCLALLAVAPQELPAAAAPAQPPAAVNPTPAIAEVTSSGPTSVSGGLTSDRVWSPQGSPYVLTGDVRVMDGVT